MTTALGVTATRSSPPLAGTRQRRLSVVAVGAVMTLFALLAGGLLATWQEAGAYGPVGDEPHYLTISASLLDGALEPTAAYEAEQRERRFWSGWLPPGETINDKGKHTVTGPRGSYSVHNLGLPAVLAVPAAVAGVDAARGVLVLVGAVIPALAFVAARRMEPDLPLWLAATVAVAVGCALPFLVASTRIYPDVAAGVLAAGGCLALWGRRTSSPAGTAPHNGQGRGAAAALVVAALLPWLQIKFAVLAVPLGIAALHRLRHSAPGRVVRHLAVPAASAAALLAYNAYAFADVTGPYGEGALQLSGRAVQTATGLLVDHNHGLLVGHPLLVVSGVVGTVLLWSRARAVAVVTAVSAAGVVALNGMHENWYGGFGFAGRFAVTAGVLMVLPATALLAAAARRAPRSTTAVLAASIALQMWNLWRVADPERTSLLRQPEGTPLPVYGNLYRSAGAWLPALHDPSWAWAHLPNVLWPAAVAAGSAVAVPVVRRRLHPRALAATALASVAVLTAVPVVTDVPVEARTWRYDAALLPSTTGTLTRDGREADPRLDDPGFLAHGPLAPLPAGSYRAVFRLQPLGGDGGRAGRVDVVLDDEVLASDDASAARGQWPTLSFELRTAGRVQARLAWSGEVALRLTAVEVVADP